MLLVNINVLQPCTKINSANIYSTQQSVLVFSICVGNYSAQYKYNQRACQLCAIYIYCNTCMNIHIKFLAFLIIFCTACDHLKRLQRLKSKFKRKLESCEKDELSLSDRAYFIREGLERMEGSWFCGQLFFSAFCRDLRV